MEKRSKIRFGIDDAVQYIFTPGGSDSEMSDLYDSESEDEDGIEHFRVGEDLEKMIPCDGSDGSDSDEDAMQAATKQTPHEGKQKRSYRWCHKQPPVVDEAFGGEEFSLPPEAFADLSPLYYFQQFWDDSITCQLVEQTNLYSVQKTGKSINTTKDEMEQFIGIQMKMSIVKMPRYQNYWAAETRYSPVADVMSLKRYEKIRQFLHANDNSQSNNPDNKGNRLFKVEPVLLALQKNCQKLEQEEYQSIDEQIVPAKTKYSGIRQYNPKKPHKWGFKNFVRAGKSGIIYDFFFYTGAGSTGKKSCSAKDVVLRLCENVPKHCNYKMFFDNWFSTLDLCLELKDLGILSTATIRSNRLAGCPLKSEAELKKEGRGSVSYQTDLNSGITVTRWYDNKCVQLTSTHVKMEIADKPVKRWDSSTKSHIDVQCPTVVVAYNGSMGGVDLVDMLIALYRTKIKSKRWYLLLIFHGVDIAKINAWLLYKRYCSQLKISYKKQMSLLIFISKLSDALIKAGKESSCKRPAGRPSKRASEASDAETPKRGRAAVVALPDVDSRFDMFGHWPEYRKKKNKCRLCKSGYSRVYCLKCNICLCLTSDRNCFKDFHKK